jgi:hypothetical protein
VVDAVAFRNKVFPIALPMLPLLSGACTVSPYEDEILTDSIPVHSYKLFCLFYLLLLLLVLLLFVLSLLLLMPFMVYRAHGLRVSNPLTVPRYLISSLSGVVSSWLKHLAIDSLMAFFHSNFNSKHSLYMAKLL